MPSSGSWKPLRILLVSGSLAHPDEDLAVAVRLAANLEAEILGMFIEDDDLARLAELPFAAEILYPTAAQRRLNVADLAAAFRNQAAAVRRTLRTLALREQVQWSFEVLRGELLRTALQTAAVGDVLMIARASERVPPDRVPPQKRPVAAYFDGTRSAKRTALTAAVLAERQQAPMMLICSFPGDLAATREEGLQWVRETLPRAGAIVHDAYSAAEFLREANDHHARIVLVASDSTLARELTAPAMWRRVRRPLGLVVCGGEDSP